MSIAKYSNYSAEDFIEDAKFQEWVENPTPENQQFWKEFLTQYPQQENALQQARQLLLNIHEYFESTGKTHVKANEAFRKSLLRKMEESKASKRLGRIRSIRWVAVAASVLIALGTSWFFLRPVQMLTISTAYEEWKTLQLPDSSIVTLNANSRIKYAENWDTGQERKVWIEGEAYFEVKKKPETGAKFQVISPDLTIEVLGTSFNVHSRGEETDVYLVEGKIKLEMGEEEEFLEPGDFLAYSSAEKKITQQFKAEKESYTSWKDGTCILNQAPVGKILGRIEEIYGVSFQVENEAILDQVKTIAIPLDKLEITLPILEQLLEVEIIQADEQLIVK